MDVANPRSVRAGAFWRRLPWSRWAVAGSLALSGVYAYRTGWAVWPHLFRNGGDLEGYFHAAGEMLAGRSPFVERFDYPPLAALLALPFHPLGLDGARVAWFLASQLCLLGAAVALFRALGGSRAAGWTVAVLWAMAGALPENLALGQIQPLPLLLLCLAWRWDGLLPPGPARAAGAIGMAAAIKIWPGVLLAAYLGRGRRRALLWGAGAAAAAMALPLILIALLLPPPHLPPRAEYWLGTPAFLNTSLPALALRLTDPEYRADGPPPEQWRIGHEPGRIRLEAERLRLSIAVSLVTLALGMAVIALRKPARLSLLAALTALATLASPIAWYHYQIFQLPALALLGYRALRHPVPWRRWAQVAGVALLAFALTRGEARDLLLGGGTAAQMLQTGAVLAALHLTLLTLLLLSREREREGPVLPCARL